MKMNKDITKIKGDGRTKIQNVQFYNITPRAINCMAYAKLNNKLALARNDGSIEIWDMEHAPYLQKTSPKIMLDGDCSVESIAWAGNRLFSAGLTGELFEWDTTLMVQQRQHRVTGNAIWCLSVNRQCTELAVGTEEGYINVFNIANNELQYKLLYDKQEGRVICCSYDATGNYLVTGSVEALRVWNARTGHAMQKMTLPKSLDNHNTVIWTLQVLEDFSIIAGDSRGYITVYDGHTGDHVEAHQVLKTDVLALHVNEARDMLVCSGVEPVIRIYAKTQIKREDSTFYRWVKYLQRAVHDHDVKSLLCITDDRILSGGIDGYLGVSFITRMRSTISRQPPFLQPPCATVSGVAKFLLLRYPAYLEIWRLGTAKRTNDNEKGKKSVGKSCTLEIVPIKLLQFRSKNDAHILCSTISPNGKWICYSAGKETRLFNIISAQDTLKITRLERNKNTILENSPATHVNFSNDSQSLFIVTRLTRQLLIFTQEQENDFTHIETIDLDKHLKGSIIHLTLSANADRIAIADDEHTISIWHCGKSNKKFVHHLNLPRYDAAATTSIALHADIPRIVAVFSDNRIAEYDLERAHYTVWWDQSYVVSNTETHCVTQVLLDERNTDIILLQNDGFLYTLEKYLPQNEENDMNHALKSKKPKILNSNPKDRQMLSLRLKFQKQYEHLVHTCWLSSDELVTVSVNPNSLAEQLPPAYAQKKYGAA